MTLSIVIARRECIPHLNVDDIRRVILTIVFPTPVTPLSRFHYLIVFKNSLLASSNLLTKAFTLSAPIPLTLN